LAVKIISDVHGEYAALRDQLAPDDIAVLLGDYLNLIDFRTLDGILAEVYSKEEVVRALALIASGDKEQVRQQIRATIGGAAEKNEMVRERIAQSYEEFFASIPCKCFMLYGNTDGPEVMRAFVRGNTELIESGVVEIDGEKFGMVSGAPLGPWNIGLPGEMETDRYNALIASLGPVDVLCTHYPPAVPELTWDTLANRDEAGSDAILSFIEEYSPAYHYFGHVHSPRVSCMVHGRTRTVNAGFFKQHKTALIHPCKV
jgi:Icc-related predicted phosphoesterase